MASINDDVFALDMTDGDRIADVIFRRLRGAIVRHEIPADYHLSVPQLAAQFGTSRSPVHEAVKRLVQEGLATEYPRRGAFVTAFRATALLPLYELRCVLDGFAAGLAAERGSSAVVAQLRAVLDQEAEAVARDDVERHIEIDMEFHRLIISAASNPALEETLAGLYERIRGAITARVVPTGPAQALADHRAVLEAVERRDPAAADKAARAHVMRIYTKLLSRKFDDSSVFV
jgi:DNA-binding GntR family transcriptional regulator